MVYHFVHFCFLIIFGHALILEQWRKGSLKVAFLKSSLLIIKILLSGPPRDVHLQGTYNTRKKRAGTVHTGTHRHGIKFCKPASKFYQNVQLLRVKFKRTKHKQRTLNRISV
jgi:hypothetical protein